MFSKQHFTISIAIILVFAIRVDSVHALDYFVDAKDGNDSWDGKSQSFEGGTHGPWRSSNGPNWSGNFLGDDRILFKRGGIYSRLLVTTRHQSSDGHPITFGAYGEGEKPIITIASNVVSSWTDIGGSRYSSQLSTSSVETVLEDWHNLKKAGDNSLADGNWYIENTSKVLYYRPTSGMPVDHEIRFGNAAGLGFWQKADNFIIQDLHFIGSGIYHGESGPDPFRNIIIERCDFSENATNWLAATRDYAPYNGGPADNIVIQDCTFRNAQNNIYFVAQDHGAWDHLIVRRNKFIDTDIAWDGHRYSGLKLDGSGGDIDGISVQNIRNSIFEYNEITGGCYSGGITIWFSNGFAGTNNVIRYNYIHDIDPNAINYGGEDNGTCNAKIYGNIIENTGNIPAFWGSYWGGLRLNRQQTPETPSQVYNNTIVNSDVGIFLYTGADNYYFQNNLVINPKSSQYIRMNFGLLNNMFNHNIYFGGTAFNLSYQNKSFSSWKTSTNQDANSLESDPLLANVSGVFSDISDFKPQSASPAINAGTDIGFTSDFEGTSVPQGSAPDIGAFEKIIHNTDLNEDGAINVSDLDILKTDFLKFTPNLSNARSDINCDGQCTARDLGILMSNFGK
jgi:hypothetical protein